LAEPEVSSNPYDVDVVVIGGGPAGLAAATRVRWVKGYHAMASSVAICESGAVGGLLRWGSCILTGQQWAYRGEDLTATLLEEVTRLNIPIKPWRIAEIEREGPGFRVTNHTGETLTCLAVIIATGFRSLANESDYYLRGVRITFKGYDHFPSLIQSCAKDAAGRGMVVVGNHKTRNLDTLLADWTAGAGPVTVLDTGRLVEVFGAERVEGVVVERDGRTERIPCGAVLMDYNAFELTPDFPIDGIDIARDERGFIIADRFLRTSQPGVFAAGDITGRYASTIMALGDGVCAGFSAYSHVFEAKFGRAPSLFAYAPTDGVLPSEPIDLPPLPDDSVPIALGPAPDWVDDQHSLAEIAETRACSTDSLRDALARSIMSKHVTVHRVATADDSFPRG
jgi:thioredoxin reductase